MLLLFDYDGTLSPIAARPDLAVLPSETRNSIQTLNNKEAYSLGIVSGRGLKDVAAMVDVPGLIYAGNHGLEMQWEKEEFTHPEALALQPVIDSILGDLDDRLSGQEGVLVEGKGLTLSVHYRLTPESLRPQVHAEFDAALSDHVGSGRVRITRGKEVLEVRPNISWDKGRAIDKIASQFSATTLAAYFGDDATDEDGFAAIRELGGISVFVGVAREPTRALYRVDSPAEVAETLRLLTKL